VGEGDPREVGSFSRSVRDLGNLKRSKYKTRKAGPLYSITNIGLQIELHIILPKNLH